MANDAISAQGTVVARAPAATPTTFTAIGNLHNITPPSLTRNPIETTSHNDPEDSYVVGIKRRGEISFNLGFVPSGASHGTASGLMKSWDTGTKDGWRITFPDGATWTFSGYLTNISPSAPVDEELTADISIQPTGVHLFT
jgi:hypothetical protein